MGRVLRSLLLTDLVDSTAPVESLEEERAAEVWAAHDEVGDRSGRARLPFPGPSVHEKVTALPAWEARSVA